MQSKTPPRPLANRLPVAAKLIGVSPRTLWQLIHDGEIGCVRAGHGTRKMLLIPTTELERWLKENTQRGTDHADPS